MKTIYKIFAIALLMSFLPGSSVKGAPVNPQEAERIARDFLKGVCDRVDMSEASNPVLKSVGKQSSPEFFIFNRKDTKGFVIVSGDDRVVPVLGFALEGSINGDSIPDGLSDHLAHLREEIKWIRTSETTQTFEASGPKSEKGIRLVTPAWNQSGFPYNALIPGNVHAGCVPAAMSIIMGAWKWPDSGEGSSTHSGSVWNGQLYEYDINLNHEIQFNLDKIPFKYDPTVASVTEELSLANLLYHTSVAAESQYNSDGSGAHLYKAREALIDHFKYSPDIPAVEYNRSLASIKSDLKKEITEGRPVMYAADGNGTGHAFVCDGVWDDYFHFNLGWGGYANGWYLLSGIYNQDGGTGFIYDPYIVKGICPRSTEEGSAEHKVEMVYDYLPEEREDPKIEVSAEFSPVEFNAEFGVGLASPCKEYSVDKRVPIYVSGLKLTGRFDGTSSVIEKLDPPYAKYRFALGITDKDGNLKKIYEEENDRTTYAAYIDSSVKLFYLTPDFTPSATDCIRLYTKDETGTGWKWIRGMPGTKDELSCSAPSTDYLPFNVDYDRGEFSLTGASGQLTGKVVIGQRYTLYVEPKIPMESVEFLNNGDIINTTVVLNSNDNTVAYYGCTVPFVDERGINLTVRPLQKYQTDMTVNMTTPGTLHTFLEGKESQLRSLTVTGKIDVSDLRWLDTHRAPMNTKLSLFDAEIMGSSVIHKDNRIPDRFYYNNIAIKELSLPKNLKSVGDYAFSYCPYLEKLLIPAELTDIWQTALLGNPLKEVWNLSTVPQEINEGMISGLSSESVLYVPEGSLEAYSSHEMWGRFPRIVEMDMTGVSTVKNEKDEVQVIFRDGHLVVTGYAENSGVMVYTLSGMLLWKGATTSLPEIVFPVGQPLIVIVGPRAFKVL